VDQSFERQHLRDASKSTHWQQERRNTESMTADGGPIYLTLPSNSSFDFFPDNVISNYRTRLTNPLRFSDMRYEIGLFDIQYPNTWYNLKGDSGYLMVESDGRREVVKIQNGYYADARSLVDQINVAHGTAFNATEDLLSLHPITEKVTIWCPSETRVWFSQTLVEMLGLGKDGFDPGIWEGQYVVDTRRGFYAIYVYCDAIQPRVVGDTLSPLLQVLPIKGKHGDIIWLSYANVQYHPVKCTDISDIHIDIRTDSGENVAFERGKVVATLALRRKPLALL